MHTQTLCKQENETEATDAEATWAISCCSTSTQAELIAFILGFSQQD